MAYITNVEILGGFRLRLTFKNRARKTVNLEPILIGPIFGSFRDHSKFSQVRINKDFGCLEWPNGADICPDALYSGRLLRRVDNFSGAEREILSKLSERYNRVSGMEKKAVLRKMVQLLDRAKPYKTETVIVAV
jgi:hypothetical protein